jgi:hypothetical protein
MAADGNGQGRLVESTPRDLLAIAPSLVAVAWIFPIGVKDRNRLLVGGQGVTL